MVRSSRVDQPPVSGVPVAGATEWASVGSKTFEDNSLGMDLMGDEVIEAQEDNGP